MTITESDIYAAAKHLATCEGDGWVFEPPKMDGVTRSGTAKEVYLRIAEGTLAAVEASRANSTPPQEECKRNRLGFCHTCGARNGEPHNDKAHS